MVAQDYAPYPPSYGEPAAFIASPIFDDEELLGALVFQMPRGKLNRIASSVDDELVNGESMLVGSDGPLRSQSQGATEPTILKVSIPFQLDGAAGGLHRSLKQDANQGIDYLVAYTTVDTLGLDWTMLTRVEADVALSPETVIMKTATAIALCSMLLVGLFSFFLGRKLYHTLGGDPADITEIADA